MPTVTSSPELTLLYVPSGAIGVTLHELGHLLVPLRVSRAPVNLQVGPDWSRPLLRFTVGRVNVDVRRVCFWGGRAIWQAPLSPGQRALALALGPFTSLLLTALGVALVDSGVKAFGRALAGYSAVQALITLLPLRRYPAWVGLPGTPSDGAQLLALYRSWRQAA